MEIRWVYMTAGSMPEAETIARALVESRLAACVNLVDRMRSIYRWQGTVHEESEVVLIAKTTADRLAELEAKVKALHSYRCPCIVALPVVDGHRPFLEWVADQVG